MIHDGAKCAPAQKVGRDKIVGQRQKILKRKKREKLTNALNAGL